MALAILAPAPKNRVDADISGIGLCFRRRGVPHTLFFADFNQETGNPQKSEKAA
jgi:hypothetical protein